MDTVESLIPIERIASQIYVIRSQQVMLDSDLAALYGVSTGRLNEQVTRNRKRFPEDFMFRLSAQEFENLRSQFATSSWGGRRYAPRAFTEQGVAMLSSVLRSERAVQVNIAIVRTFVRLRQVLANHEDLARKVAQHDREIAQLFKHVKALLEPPNLPEATDRLRHVTRRRGHRIVRRSLTYEKGGPKAASTKPLRSDGDQFSVSP